MTKHPSYETLPITLRRLFPRFHRLPKTSQCRDLEPDLYHPRPNLGGVLSLGQRSPWHDARRWGGAGDHRAERHHFMERRTE